MMMMFIFIMLWRKSTSPMPWNSRRPICMQMAEVMYTSICGNVIKVKVKVKVKA